MPRKKKKEQAHDSDEIMQNKGLYVSWGKCNGCPFLTIANFIADPKNWRNTKIFLRCEVYNETIQQTECIRNSEEAYEKESCAGKDSLAPAAGFARPVGVTKTVNK